MKKSNNMEAEYFLNLQKVDPIEPMIKYWNIDDKPIKEGVCNGKTLL